MLVCKRYIFDLEKTKKHLEEEQRRDPDNPLLSTLLGILHYFEYQDLKAVRQLKRALSVNKN